MDYEIDCYRYLGPLTENAKRGSMLKYKKVIPNPDNRELPCLICKSGAYPECLEVCPFYGPDSDKY